MDRTIQSHLDYIGLSNLRQNWNVYLKEAVAKKSSYHSFLSSTIEDEYHWLVQKKRSTRNKRACIPDLLVMETFPFELQPRLKRNWLWNCMTLCVSSKNLRYYALSALPDAVKPVLQHLI